MFGFVGKRGRAQIPTGATSVAAAVVPVTTCSMHALLETLGNCQVQSCELLEAHQFHLYR